MKNKIISLIVRIILSMGCLTVVHGAITVQAVTLPRTSVMCETWDLYQLSQKYCSVIKGSKAYGGMVPFSRSGDVFYFRGMVPYLGELR